MYRFLFRRSLSSFPQRPNNWLQKFTEQQPTTIRYLFKKQQNDRSYFLYALLGSSGLGFGVYYWTHLEHVPISNRKRFMAFSEQEEKQISIMSESELMRQYRSRILSAYHPYSQQVLRVTERLVDSGEFQKQNWQVNVIQSDEVNAFVLPGGKIYVFTGLLKMVPNDDCLAAVLGHEIGHQLARHAGEKLSMFKLLYIFKFIASFFVDVSFLFNPIILSLGFVLPFSRKCETEADYIGLILMSRAGYDPRQSIVFWEKMKLVNQAMNISFFSTHPNNDERIEKLKKWMPKAMQIYQERIERDENPWAHIPIFVSDEDLA